MHMVLHGDADKDEDNIKSVFFTGCPTLRTSQVTAFSLTHSIRVTIVIYCRPHTDICLILDSVPDRDCTDILGQGSKRVR